MTTNAPETTPDHLQHTVQIHASNTQLVFTTGAYAGSMADKDLRPCLDFHFIADVMTPVDADNVPVGKAFTGRFQGGRGAISRRDAAALRNYLSYFLDKYPEEPSAE